MLRTREEGRSPKADQGVCFLYSPSGPRFGDADPGRYGDEALVLAGRQHGQIVDPDLMPTKRAILAELTSHELRAIVDRYEPGVRDRRVKAQLVDAVARSRKARIGRSFPAFPGTG